MSRSALLIVALRRDTSRRRALQRFLAVQLAVASTLAVLAVSREDAGNYMPPGGDGVPMWLADGTIAFRGRDVQAVNADGSNAHVVAAGQVWAFHPAPTIPLVAFAAYDTSSKQWLSVAQLDGSQT